MGVPETGVVFEDGVDVEHVPTDVSAPLVSHFQANRTHRSKKVAFGMGLAGMRIGGGRVLLVLGCWEIVLEPLERQRGAGGKVRAWC